MTPVEFREILQRLHLTHAGVAQLLGVHVRTIGQWADLKGSIIAPPAVRVVLRALDEHRLSAAQVKRLAR